MDELQILLHVVGHSGIILQIYWFVDNYFHIQDHTSSGLVGLALVLLRDGVEVDCGVAGSFGSRVG